MTEEIWRDVVGYSGLYSVSNLGRVKSHARTITRVRYGKPYGRREPERILKPYQGDSYGHLHVGLHRDGVRDIRYVHVLVLEAFVGPRPDGSVARHLSGKPTQNALGNLAWGTPLENAADMAAHGNQTRGETHPGARLTEAAVRHIRANRGVLSRAELAARFGVSDAAIQHSQEGRTWRHVA